MALKVKQLREESTARLREMLVETQEKLFKHKMRVATGEGVNPHEAGETRRDSVGPAAEVLLVEVVPTEPHAPDLADLVQDSRQRLDVLLEALVGGSRVRRRVDVASDVELLGRREVTDRIVAVRLVDR